MPHYRFLVMQSNDKNNVGFLTETMGGSYRSADVNTNVTHFDSHFDNRHHWNSAGDLIVGFSGWYLRKEEGVAYNMGNRIYAATNTYRFFRVDEDLDDNFNDQIDLANKNLKPFEITQQEFIKNIFESREFKQICELFPDRHGGLNSRSKATPVKVQIVYNSETKSWCWISDYINYKPEEFLTKKTMHIKVGLVYEDAVKYISARANCEYRFGGNDAYYKRKELESKNLEVG